MIRHLLIFVLLFNISTVYSQGVKVIRDLRLRTGLGIEKEFFKELTVYGETAVEFEHDMSLLGKYYAEAGLTYRFFGFLDPALEYRYTYNRKSFSNEFNNRHRIAFHVQARKKMDRLRFYYRLRYQSQDDDLAFYNETRTDQSILKNRVKLKYNLKGTKLSPYCSSELYLYIQDNFSAGKIKATFGGEYDLDRFGELIFYYRLERELGSSVPYLFGTFGLFFSYKF